MSDWTPEDVLKINKGEGWSNYGNSHYEPKDFWEKYGDTYYYTFGDPNNPEHRKTKSNPITLNLGWFVPRIQELNPKSVLEVGCGFGRCMPYVLDNCNSLDEIVGIELSKPMLDKSKLYLSTYPRRNKLKIIQGNAKDIPFEDNSFELTYTHVCLTHIPPDEVDKAISEISRVTSKWVIHVERFRYLYEHSLPHVWSHLLPPKYIRRGWKIHEYAEINEEHMTKMLVLKNGQVVT